jgi:two-component system, NtrC family, sensor histidine kinase HydH
VEKRKRTRSPRGREPSGHAVGIERLPVATLVTRDGVLVAVNSAYEELTGRDRSELVGRTVKEVIGLVVDPMDRGIFAQLASNRQSRDPRKQGSLWCRILRADGVQRAVRVEWELADNEALVFMLDARPEAFGQEVTEALASAAGTFSRCASEAEVLERAVGVLCDRGFTATILLWVDDDPLLRYGPTRSPKGGRARSFESARLRREILVQLNPSFMDRRSAFFQDGVRVVREVFPMPVAEQLAALLPATRMVQAPIFVADSPYGALVVTSDALSPLVATALELFAELVGTAIENIRLRVERVERERLAALGEAAGVMAHEVRNPVGAIMNALALLDREDRSVAPNRALLAIISEETVRLEQLVTQLLELGRPLLPRPRAYALEELTRKALRLLESRGELGDRAVEMPPAGETLAWIDPDLLELALVNVLRNAAQSTGKGARMRVLVQVVDDFVRWTLEDDGPGIPDEVARKLGQPFVTTRATGTGMGLAVVRRIMEASGGRLSIGRAALGGAEVSLDLQLAKT